MAINFVVKAADIRKTVEEIEGYLRNQNHLLNQLHNDSNFNVAKVLFRPSTPRRHGEKSPAAAQCRQDCLESPCRCGARAPIDT